ncbi:maleylpyruvate isomerase N-terminal domain-containing protein [Saccharopolyspora sp. NFXS83]|uniref:maleylpyruvate isomerase N-terminal domain-containing protein n=1 Tax=Saccharopolyspora sp. NFXS83 TaxID=2993560 RepID=UPI00224B4BA8|nr:maleylpyruvate isomerase N-terminal domain-containing protein [Saccharopolyspora sp. NFXS83]MCX2729675.1 maleylpyruvate isomerase N-terminal domain-containing protein [Saccharopolyspora sp. NFXS83]
MELFSLTWTALRTAVAELADEDFARPSGCTGWLVRDLACHLVIDAQDVLITLAAPVDEAATRDAATYWDASDSPPTGDDPLDALTVRLAAAYQEPWLLQFHLDDVGSAADRAAALVPHAASAPAAGCSPRPTTCPRTSSSGLHLDLIAHLPGAADPPTASLAASRALLARIAGATFPTSFSHRDALLIGTGRREPTDAERTAVGALARRVPLILG